jgi:integrase
MGFYDFDEYERPLEAARGLGPTAHLVALLGGEAGLRCGEMIGLEWSDADLVKRQMCIQRSDWRGHVTVPWSSRGRGKLVTTSAEGVETFWRRQDSDRLGHCPGEG